MPKRSRNDGYIPVTDRKRYPTLWFDDGNIVLTTNVSQFRVHRSLLSMNSPVFADMFSMPQTDRLEDTVEGLPVVEISDDDTDLTHLLYFFYDHRYYQGGTETTFEKISGLLRMGTKYQMDDLRNEIIDHLSLAYPSTLEKYLKAVNPKTRLPLFPPFLGQHFAIVNLARETDASILLPAALWRSTCMITFDIVEGPEDSTGTKYILFPTDVKRCIQQKSNSYKMLMKMEHSLPDVPKASECCPPKDEGSVGTCREVASSTVLHHFSISGPEIRDDIDFFTQMDAFEVWRSLVCTSCRKWGRFKALSLACEWVEHVASSI
ncbi:hypothetical protein BD410DRAFT_901871 [Rickenella mellea]|uniref:BTB domain-containing protein n=1 Tax=Rickenella mellea TaxID=50990 RepID=A0A4Y7PPA4_9AGAM|nr:hypothetical protein BD410DRAFT_901871 [Rickenella mellea]